MNSAGRVGAGAAKAVEFAVAGFPPEAGPAAEGQPGPAEEKTVTVAGTALPGAEGTGLFRKKRRIVFFHFFQKREGPFPEPGGESASPSFETGGSAVGLDGGKGKIVFAEAFGRSHRSPLEKMGGIIPYAPGNSNVNRAPSPVFSKETLPSKWFSTSTLRMKSPIPFSRLWNFVV